MSPPSGQSKGKGRRQQRRALAVAEESGRTAAAALFLHPRRVRRSEGRGLPQSEGAGRRGEATCSFWRARIPCATWCGTGGCPRLRLFDPRGVSGRWLHLLKRSAKHSVPVYVLKSDAFSSIVGIQLPPGRPRVRQAAPTVGAARRLARQLPSEGHSTIIWERRSTTWTMSWRSQRGGVWLWRGITR